MFDEFEAIVNAETFVDVNATIDRVVELESRARQAMESGDPQASAGFANQAYGIFMDLPMRLTPTLILALADRVNRADEAYWAYLNHVEKKVMPMLENLKRSPSHGPLALEVIRLLSVQDEGE